MKIVGNTSSQEECDQIEDIVKTFLVGQHARHLATKKTKHPQHPKKHTIPPIKPPQRPLQPSEPTLFTVKGLT
jgi:hypothetical protein